ncbi:MAG: type VI secretion system amidase immunity protein Tai4 [Azoarcus sp.]|jgi:hypothetical protein|nr:type VI secretion system amidase immunity protein Tai4 [Azoarcus sp.]
MKRSLFVLLLLYPAITHAGMDQRNNATNFKDRALAFCIAKAYKDTPTVELDARKTGGFYLEKTYFDLDADPKMNALIDKYLRYDYRMPIEGFVDAKFDLLKCIDMYHSLELDELVRKYVPHPDWIGNKPPENRRK